MAILVDRKISSQDVMDQLFNLFVFRGILEHIRSEFTDPRPSEFRIAVE